MTWLMSLGRGVTGFVPRHTDGLAVHANAAAVRCLEQIDTTQERALARAGATQHGDDVALAGIEMHTLEDLDRTKALVQILHHQGGRFIG